ncbi:E set domain-containing protein, partial [Wolfiporia cocos MD-104 SS10]
RSDTLLSFGVSQTRNTAELRALMGNANARLKPGATVVPRNRRALRQEAKDGAQGPVSLEQAKPRARVEVDIVLENNACVQGGYLRGHVKIRVRKRSKKEAPILLADGKIRVIGFECIPSEADRHTFYQCASPLSAIATGLDRLYELPSDTDGFAQAIEGVHILPFAMRLPADGKFGAAKGITSVHSGVAVQYIAMVSVKVKCSKTGRRSIAHFYRHCEVWPRINPSVVLVPAPRPLQAATSKGLSVLSSNSKVKLTALVHRLTWVAGQRCYVNVHVVNETKKTVKSLTLTLVRTTTLFRPKPFLDAGQARTADPDACQTNTMHKVVAESILEMAHRGTKGHASAKGWWTGVAPGQELSFSHYILIPPDALSVTRGRLLEVEHSLRVTLSAGSLSSDIHVTLPIRIINFMSIDPIPSDNSHPTMGAHVRPLQRRRSIDGELAAETYPPHTWSALAQGGYTGIPSFTSSLYDHVSSHEDQLTLLQRAKKTRRAVEAPRPRPSGSILRVRNPDRDTHESSTSDAAPSSSGEDDDSMTSASEAESHTRGLDSLELDDPDSDEEVGMVI